MFENDIILHDKNIYMVYTDNVSIGKYFGHTADSRIIFIIPKKSEHPFFRMCNSKIRLKSYLVSICFCDLSIFTEVIYYMHLEAFTVPSQD